MHCRPLRPREVTRGDVVLARRAPDPPSSSAAPARSGSADGTGSRSAGRSGSADRRPRAALCDSRPGTSLGTAVSSPCVYGCRGFVNSSSVGACSTIRPRYITATRSATCRTTAMLCAISSTVSPSFSRSSSSRFSTVACTDTSSADTGSSAIEQLGLERERPRDRHPLPLAARELPRMRVERTFGEPDQVEQLDAACVDPAPSAPSGAPAAAPTASASPSSAD